MIIACGQYLLSSRFHSVKRVFLNVIMAPTLKLAAGDSCRDGVKHCGHCGKIRSSQIPLLAPQRSKVPILLVVFRLILTF